MVGIAKLALVRRICSWVVPVWMTIVDGAIIIDGTKL